MVEATCRNKNLRSLWAQKGRRIFVWRCGRLCQGSLRNLKSASGMARRGSASNAWLHAFGAGIWRQSRAFYGFQRCYSTLSESLMFFFPISQSSKYWLPSPSANIQTAISGQYQWYPPGPSQAMIIDRLSNQLCVHHLWTHVGGQIDSETTITLDLRRHSAGQSPCDF